MEQKRHSRITLKYEFQFRMIRRAMLPVFLLSAAACAIIWFATGVKTEYTMTELRWMGIAGITCLFLASLVGVAWSLVLYSVRLAGPLIHLEKVLSQIATGDLAARVQLRKSDELQEHGHHLNRAFISLSDRVKRIHQYCTYTRARLKELAEKNAADATFLSQIKQIEELVGLIEEAVADFKVE